MCKYGHTGPRYTSTGGCLACCRRQDVEVAPPDRRVSDMAAKLHAVQTDLRQTVARLKILLRKFDAEGDPLQKVRLSEAIGREHNAAETLRREAAGLELQIEASRPMPDPLRLASLLSAAGAPPTPPPARFKLTAATPEQIQTTRLRLDSDPDQVRHKAQMARDTLLRETTRARLMAEHLDNCWTSEEGSAMLAQVRSEMNLAPLPSVEPYPRTEEHDALVSRILRTKD